MFSIFFSKLQWERQNYFSVSKVFRFGKLRKIFSWKASQNIFLTHTHAHIIWASWYFCWQTAFRSVKSWRFRRLSLIIWSVAAGGASIPFKRPSVRAVRFRRRFSYIQIFAAVCPSFNRYLSFACLSFNIASSYNPFNQIHSYTLAQK